jgi:hypothetical protein
VRVGLAIVETVAVAKGDVALACGARATTLLGDAVIGTGKNH